MSAEPLESSPTSFSNDPPTWPIKRWQEVFAIVGLPLLLYSGSLGYDLLGYDDAEYYLNNPALHGGGAQGLVDIWRTYFFSEYFPITQFSYWLDLALFGSASWWGARIHGLLWLSCGAWAVRCLVLRVTGRRGLALGVAMLYLAHPVTAPSALWLAERKNLLSFAFSFWSLERYIVARESSDPAQARINGVGAWILAVLGLLSKAHAVAVPLMLLSYELTLGKGAWGRRLAGCVPFALAAALFTLFSLTYLRDDLGEAYLGGSRVGALVSDGPILVRYLVHTLAPLQLSLLYGGTDIAPTSGWGWGAWALLLLISGFGWWLSRRRGVIAFGWLLGFAALLPALNWVAQALPMADHYHQWALPGWLLVGCLMVEEALERIASTHARRLSTLLAAAGCLWFAFTAWSRVPEFSSRRALFTTSVQHQPEAAVAHAQLAFAILDGTLIPEIFPRQATAASLRALTCPDEHRIPPEPRGRLTRMAAWELRLQGKPDEAAALVERECAKMLGSWEPLANLVRAQVSVDAGDAKKAVGLLENIFPENHRKAAKLLRAACRSGAVQPYEIRPILNLPFTKADQVKNNVDRWFFLEQQRVLGEALLLSGEAERAFDVAVVLVNMAPDFELGRVLFARIYRQLLAHQSERKEVELGLPSP